MFTDGSSKVSPNTNHGLLLLGLFSSWFAQEANEANNNNDCSSQTHRVTMPTNAFSATCQEINSEEKLMRMVCEASGTQHKMRDKPVQMSASPCPGSIRNRRGGVVRDTVSVLRHLCGKSP